MNSPQVIWRKIKRWFDEVDLHFFGAVCVLIAIIFFWLALEVGLR